MTTKHADEEVREGFSFSPNGFIFLLNACGVFAIFAWLYGTSDATEWVRALPTVSLIVCISHLSSVLLQVWFGCGSIRSVFVPLGCLLCVALVSGLVIYAFATTEGAIEAAPPELWFACGGSITAFGVAVAMGWRRVARGVRARPWAR